MWPFSKKRRDSYPLKNDPRWQKFQGHSGPCPCCGQHFKGVFDIGFDDPDPWSHGNLTEADTDHLIVKNDILTEDLCQFDGHNYVRGVLHLPIIGSDKVFGFGIWGTLSKENFTAYRSYNDIGTPFGGAFSYIANSMPTFETSEFLPADLMPQPNNMRPLIWAH